MQNTGFRNTAHKSSSVSLQVHSTVKLKFFIEHLLCFMAKLLCCRYSGTECVLHLLFYLEGLSHNVNSYGKISVLQKLF
jgi:hypothetical protein